MVDLLGDALVAATLAGCLVTLGIVASFLRLLVRYRKLRVRGLAEERKALAHPLPPDDELPHVVVQIACFDEGALVERGIANAAGLDWPRDRLHVQVLDDSTDDTVDRARDAAERFRARGVDVSVLHREARRGYKAGALREGMARTAHDYFAVFDVDYVYPPDFLRRCMTPLLADPGLGFVQARLEVFNGSDNPLTRAQRLVLDFHHGFEQVLRCWSGGMVPFNGTGGVWRRRAIEAAGGWRGITMTEDLDLSCRAWLQGWRGAYLSSVTAAGEAPGRLGDWMTQQRRWMAGFGEVAWRTPPQLGARGGRPSAPWAAPHPSPSSSRA